MNQPTFNHQSQAEKSENSQRLFDKVDTKGNDDDFYEIVMKFDSDFREILVGSHFLIDSHADTVKLPLAYDAFVQQARNDFQAILICDIAHDEKLKGRQFVPKERHWNIAKDLYKKYSLSGDLFNALMTSTISQDSKKNLLIAITSILKNIQIYLKENHFYEFYELCRSKFEPDTIETENNSVGEINTAK
jgi:hypothetical protein